MRCRAGLLSALLATAVGCGDDAPPSSESASTGESGTDDTSSDEGGTSSSDDGTSSDDSTSSTDDGTSSDEDTSSSDDGTSSSDDGTSSDDAETTTDDAETTTDGELSCDIEVDPSESLTFEFLDTPGDDIPTDAIKTFFEGLPELCETDYMYFEVLGDQWDQGAWCSARGDWYVTTYLDVWGQSPTMMTGFFEMWFREGDAEQPWEEALPFPQQNHYGGGCGAMGAWCSNWGLGGAVFLGVLPEHLEQLSPGSELRLSSSFTDGADWEMTLRWGRSREAACGF